MIYVLHIVLLVLNKYTFWMNEWLLQFQNSLFLSKHAVGIASVMAWCVPTKDIWV